MTATTPHGATVIPYELRVGVTGHRDIADPSAVQATVVELLRYLLAVLERAAADPLGPHGSEQLLLDRLDRRLTEALAAATGAVRRVEQWADTPGAKGMWLANALRSALWPSLPVSPRHPSPQHLTPVKLTVVSALARGADRIVVRAVCAVVAGQSQERNRYVEAVLPFPQEEYERDFDAPGEIDEFRALLSLDRGAANTHPDPTVCCPNFPRTSDPAFPSGRLTRSDAYALAGRRVIDSSEILIAVWDPSHPGGHGGTADIVREAIDRRRLVFWINPARLEDGARVLRSATRQDVAPLPIRATELSPTFHRLAAYNRDSAVSDTAFRTALGAAQEALQRDARHCRVPPEASDVLAQHLLPHFVRADLLSQRYSRLRDVAAQVWPGAAALMVTLMAFQIVFWPSSYWLAWVEVFVLLMGYASSRVSQYEAWHEKWLHDRRLAEGLRSAMHVALVDAPDYDRTPGSSDTASPLPFYDPVNAWYVASMKREVAKSRRRFQHALSLEDEAQRLAVRCLLCRAWVRPQIDHHRRNVDRRARTATRVQRARFGLFAAVVVVAIAHALGVGHHGVESAASLYRLDLWIGFLTVALPAWAAAVHVITSLHDHERMGERSRYMAALLDGLADRLEAARSAADVRNRVADMERVMDLESAEWAESLGGRRPEFTG